MVFEVPAIFHYGIASSSEMCISILIKPDAVGFMQRHSPLKAHTANHFAMP